MRTERVRNLYRLALHQVEPSQAKIHVLQFKERQAGDFPTSDDVAAATARIEKLARDENLRLKLSHEAYKAARENWSIDAMLDGYLELYEKTGAST